MNKFYIDEEAYNYLNEWATENRISVIWSAYYFKRVEIILKDSPFKYYVEAVNGFYKFNFKDDNGILFSGKIVHDASGKNDFKINYQLKRCLDNAEKYGDVISTYATAFLIANCFMWRGNLIDKKEFTAVGKNENDSKVITFRKHNDTVYAIHASRHRSPEGIFSVRGHFRRYKSGKVIWIDGYLKGTEP